MGIEADDQQDVRGDFLYRYSLLRGAAGQLGERAVYQVLDKRHGSIEVGSDIEGDRKGVGTVAAAYRRHVYGVFDAVYRLLDRNTDGFCHDIGACARITRRDLDCRGNDIRILRYRKYVKRDKAYYYRDQGDDVCENRSVDKKL